VETNEAGLECRPDGGEGVGEGYESSDEEEEEEGHVTPPPPSQLRKTLPLFGDIHSRQAGIAIGLR
jgi:hypothetical protein